MQFNPSTTSGFCYEVDNICNSDSNSYPLAAKAQRATFARRRFLTLAFQADGRWSFDLLSQTTAPLESINLVSGTEKYALDTFTSEILKVLRVEILDSGSAGYVLEQLVDDDVDYQSLPQFNSVSGRPTWYRLFGKYIYLYPKPSYNSTNGLSLYISRDDSAFASSDTTKTFGTPSLFDQYLCNLAALPYLIETQKAQKGDIAGQIQRDEIEILKYFGARNEGTRNVLTMAPVNPE